jgi:hypothetical protein
LRFPIYRGPTQHWEDFLPREGCWEARGRTNDEGQQHDLQFTARQTLSALLASLPRGRHKAKQRFNSQSAKKRFFIAPVLPFIYYIIPFYLIFSSTSYQFHFICFLSFDSFSVLLPVSSILYAREFAFAVFISFYLSFSR